MGAWENFLMDSALICFNIIGPQPPSRSSLSSFRERVRRRLIGPLFIDFCIFSKQEIACYSQLILTLWRPLWSFLVRFWTHAYFSSWTNGNLLLCQQSLNFPANRFWLILTVLHTNNKQHLGKNPLLILLITYYYLQIKFVPLLETSQDFILAIKRKGKREESERKKIEINSPHSRPQSHFA